MNRNADINKEIIYLFICFSYFQKLCHLMNRPGGLHERTYLHFVDCIPLLEFCLTEWTVRDEFQAIDSLLLPESKHKALQMTLTIYSFASRTLHPAMAEESSLTLFVLVSSRA